MKKTFFLFFITMLLICSAFMNTSGAEFIGLSTNDLFIKYPYYLNNAETNEIMKQATDAYNAVMADYDENDEFISAIKSGVSTNVETTIRNFGSKLGLMDSYYEVCMDKATVDLMKTLYADENLIAALSVTEKASKTLDVVENMSDVSIINSDVIASLLYNLSADEVFDMTEVLSEKYGDVLDPLTDTADVAKYIYTACIITDVQIELVDTLMGRVDTSSQLYEGLGRLRQDMSYDIVGYTLKTFIENKALSDIAEAATGSGPMIIGQIIVKTAVWVMFDLIYPHPDADEVIANMIHSMYVMELDTALINQRLAFDSPFYVSDMEDYETVFNTYLAAVKTTLESTKALAKNETAASSLDNAKTDLENALPNYEAYLTKCKNEVLSTTEADRIIRTKDTWQGVGNQAATTVGGDSNIDNCEIIPVTDDGEIFWKIVVSSEVIIDREVSVPELRVSGYGILDIQDKITVNGKVEVEGIVKMETENAHMVVYGEYRQFYSGDGKSDYITAGTLEIKGSMYGSGYTPSGTHKTVISGTGLQSIDMHYSSRSGYFNILELKMAEVYFPDATGVRKELYSEGGKINRPENIYLTGTATIRGNVYNDAITLAGWTATESNTFNGTVYTWTSATFAAPQTVNGKCDKTTIICYGNKGTSVFNGAYTGWLSATGGGTPAVMNNQVILYGGGITDSTVEINGLLYNWDDYGGSLTLNNGRLIVSSFSNSSILKMEHDDDYILIKNRFWYDSDATSEYITNGVIEVKGDIINAYGYNPSGNHKTILSGDKKQTVNLDYTYSSKIGAFNDLEIANTSESGVYLNGKQLNINGDLIQATGCPVIYYSSNSVILQGKTAFVNYDGDMNDILIEYNNIVENARITWLDFERYLEHETGGDMVMVRNVVLADTTVEFDAYFSSNYESNSLVALVAFYDTDGNLVQMQSSKKNVYTAYGDGASHITIEFDKKDYSTYKIMIWSGIDNPTPLIKTNSDV